MAVWAVAATVSEPEELILAFAAHHLRLGAAFVHLFLDMPQPGLVARLAAERRVRVTPCDRDWWQARTGGRPAAQADRQRANLQWAHDRAGADWLWHLDADEFLDGPGTLAELLAAAPDSADAVSAVVAERVHLGPPDPDDIFAGAFRRPAPPALQDAIDRIDGAAARFLRQGLTGYPSSKAAVRTGRGLRMDIHSPAGMTADRHAHLPGWSVLHYDGLTPAHWAGKKLRTLAQRGGWATDPVLPQRHQFVAVEALRHRPDRLAALYGRLKCLDPGRAAALEALGLLRREGFDPRPALAAVFPGAAVDLSAARFDSQAQPFVPTRFPLRSRLRQRAALWHRWRHGLP